MGTNAQTMARINDDYGQKNGHTPGIVTGKPVEMGGSPGREEATGRGVVLCAAEVAKRKNLDLDGLSIAVQGFGNVGMWTVVLAAELGAKIVAVSDVGGGVYNDAGLDVEKLVKHEEESESISSFPGGDTIGNDELLEVDCDMLIPAAIHGVINTNNADKVRAKVIIEAANGPTTPAADALLNDKATLVVPDILANSGGVTVSYFEWVQDRMGYFWREDVVNERLEEIMVASFNDLTRYCNAHQVDTRTAAYMLAIDRVAYDTRMRGIYA